VIQVGQEKKAKYWGRFSVSKVARLKKPVECQCKEVGIALFEPTIVKIDWETPPSEDKHEFWFPYWITIGGKKKYGQFAPMIGEKALLELLQDAIEQDFFTKAFLKKLGVIITKKLTKPVSMRLAEYRKQLSELRTILIEGIACLSAWQRLGNLDDNMAQALSRYRGFFLPAQLSLKHVAIQKIANAFDRNPRAVSLRNLISAAKQNPKLLAPYAKKKDLEKLERKISDNEELLSHLKSYRDQRLAHYDSVVSADTSLKFGQVKQLIKDVKDMYNSLSSGHERSITSFDFLSREAERHTSKVIEIMCEDRDKGRLAIEEANRRIGKED
jgi:hypothetical protein